MPYYRFSENDILYNELKLHPKSEFLIYSGNVYYNQTPKIQGAQAENVTHIPTGHTTLYEYNVDREQDQLIHPFIKKSTSLTSFKTITTDEFNFDFSYGDTITGSYPLSASISRKYYAENEYDFSLQDGNQYRSEVEALRNTLKRYTPLNRHYQISSSYRDYTKDELNIIFIPSIFYGSSIKKGSVDFKFFISGSLAARAQDIHKNGSLVQTYPSSSYYTGSNVGLVLYDEGFAFLYSPPVYKSEFDLVFDGNDYLAITSDVKKYIRVVPFIPASHNALQKVISPHQFAESSHIAAKRVVASMPAADNVSLNNGVATPDNPQDFLGNDEQAQSITSEDIPPILNIDPLNRDFTLSAWINLTSSQSGPIIAFSGPSDDGSYVRQYSISVAGDKLVGHSGDASVTSSVDVADGTWKLVTMVSSQDTMKIFVNGTQDGIGIPGAKLAGGTSGDPALGGDQHLLIGAARSSATAFTYYDGRINEVAIWLKALTNDQVEELYNDGCPLDVTKHSAYVGASSLINSFNLPLKASSPVFYWNFENKSTFENQPYYNSLQGIPAWNPLPAGFTPTQTTTTLACLANGYQGFGEGHTEKYTGASPLTASWVHWGATGSATDRLVSSGYSLEFEGVQHTPVMTMFAYAGKAELNHSNNMTSYEWPGFTASTGSLAATATSYVEDHTIKYKNIVSGSYKGYSEPFSKQTFVSSIGIYDKDKNLVAVAKLATPLKKREVDEYIFKLKLDI